MTCPWLVKAIDEWEARGGVKEMNRRLLGKSSDSSQIDGTWEAKLKESHEDVRTIRESLLNSQVTNGMTVKFCMRTNH